MITEADGRRLAARSLLGLARRLLQGPERAHRAGYVTLAQIEWCLRVSAVLRHLAGRLIRATPARAAFYKRVPSRNASEHSRAAIR
jgi:hypothetical protein